MALSFNTNLPALNSRRQLDRTNLAVATSLERLSSGLRINSAKDAAAGLSVREGLRADLAGLRASDQNALLTGFGNNIDATSTALTTSDVTGVTDISLSGAQAGTFTFIDTAGDSQLTFGDGTVTQTISLGTILDDSDVATSTQVVANFDRLGIRVSLAGAAGIVIQLAPAALSRSAHRMPSPTGSRSTSPINGRRGRSSISAARRSAVSGRLRRRLPPSTALSSQVTQTAIESVQAAESTISDADIALEVANLTRAQVLAEAGASILAQAKLQHVTALLLLQ